MIIQEIIIAQVSPSTGAIKTESQTGTTPIVPKTDKTDPIGAVWTMLMPLLLIVGLYILFMRPQYKKEKEMKESLKKLSRGDKVVTRGGIWGTIAGIQEDIVVVKIAENVKIEVSKSAIEAVNPQDKADKKTAAKK
ncbi:MAG: preprotein translocase subunit YajC [Spirochaetia bacterium]|nr:preprotein translocase subunit YajC [Spirochaetia bacterium]